MRAALSMPCSEGSGKFLLSFYGVATKWLQCLLRLLAVDKAGEAFEAGQQGDALRTAHRRQLCTHEAHLSTCPSLSGTAGRQGPKSMVVLQRILHRYTRYRYRAVTLSSHFILISHLYGSCLSLSFA